MEYWPGEEDFLKIRLKFGESHHLGFTFHYENLLSKGYTLEEILEDFENIFLELRFCERKTNIYCLRLNIISKSNIKKLKLVVLNLIIT